MAILSDDEVKLRLAVETTGAAGVGTLADNIETLAKDAGDAAPQFQALAAEIRNIGQQQIRVTGLEAAITGAKNARAAFVEARHQVEVLDKALADAKGAGANQSAIKLLESSLKSANAELGRTEKAWSQHKDQLSQARAAATAAGIDTKNLTQEHARLRAELGAATKAAAAQEQALQAQAKSAKTAGQQIAELKTLYAAWLSAQAAGSAVSGVVATADAYTNLTAKVKMAVGEGEAFTTTLKRIEEIALNTNASLDSTATLFTKLADAGQKIGVGQADALRLTETVNQAIALSGASAQASDAALTQLIQGLQSGVLRGDEFNSVMEQAPRLAKALADGLGVTTGELRKMAEAGALSSETIVGALQVQARTLEQEFGKLPPTIGRAITDLQTQWQIWIGELDQSTGASATAAAAIEGLAKNFDFLASALINTGQAYLAWKAYGIAAEFLALKTAVSAATVAKVADTTATVANTAATQANTTAQIANNAAKVGAVTAGDAAAASVGRLAGALSLVKGLGFAFLLANIVDIGKWLGEATAKAMGYGKAIEDSENKMRAAAKAAAEAAQADAELAQQKQLAADKALGLSEQSKKLVADFGSMTKAGDSAAAALEKIGKDVDLSSIKGIADAGAALDALAQRGKISADQVQDAWEGALKGIDLQAFEVNARAAFDESEQGARRLAAALEAQLGEALRRTGKDWGTLAGGINDAAKAVLDRWVELGNAGLVTGDRLTQGLAKAKDRFDELKPGINSLAEAFEALGLKSREALQEAEASAREAFEYIKSNGGTLAELQAAWEKYGAAAKAANGGILPDVLRLQQEMYKVGDAGEAAADRIGDAWDRAAEKLGNYSAAASGASDGWVRDTAGNLLATTVDIEALAARFTNGADQADEFKRLFSGFYQQAMNLPQFYSSTQGLDLEAIVQWAAEQAASAAYRKVNSASSTSAPTAPVGMGQIVKNVYQVDLRTSSGTKTVEVANQSSADALMAVLKEYASRS
ncbi:tape measure protein [Zoogloea sp.]|uniref:tape measure protein n=1 Tax=Zoogloea sp. TaxID=49181 RepID=UPI0035B17887